MQLFVEKKVPVIALVRDPTKVPAGVEARKFNYRSDVASLVPAFAGVKTFILISSNDFNNRFGQHKAAIETAKQAGVTTVLYTSLFRRRPTSRSRPTTRRPRRTSRSPA
ncbi:hypothetical protein DFJ73DRAFT_832436 [Zopfochytrium polystomum]|nr:hypothetical protein DFJ73DRAFT_832436 [Zopfochytrium polystomum]